MSRRRNKKYSKEFKLEVVQAYLTGKGSQREICKKYKIPAKRTLEVWIKWYNGHKELRERSGFGTEIYMTKGRKTTQQERTEIVAYCIEHGKDYPLTINEYGISYQQIYSWIRKYDKQGVDGLSDGRGRAKLEAEMTENEKLKAENKILQARLKDKEMELAFIKKLKELEEGGC
jgi:transposase-like protein